MERNTNGGGKINNRVTIAMDDGTFNLLQDIREETKESQSELVRKAIKFYHKFNKLLEGNKNGTARRINFYLDLLSHGEHIILDIDHYLSFLKFVEESPKCDTFWEMNRSIGKAHAEEFTQDLNLISVENVIRRLEACNFFNIVMDAPNRFTLLLGSDIQKKFIKTFLEEVLDGMGFNFELKEGFSKIKLVVRNK
ncbi:MAG: CopG family transcriptional regulator [Candidatus Lokiarchaeota archaeon]|nr:CopG family transcriptional regulator [Candidatus Lokiarchaeota archaeon]